jgi:hypothetical protein
MEGTCANTQQEPRKQALSQKPSQNMPAKMLLNVLVVGCVVCFLRLSEKFFWDKALQLEATTRGS